MCDEINDDFIVDKDSSEIEFVSVKLDSLITDKMNNEALNKEKDDIEFELNTMTLQDYIKFRELTMRK
jgi:hypothetical protein